MGPLVVESPVTEELRESAGVLLFLQASSVPSTHWKSTGGAAVIIRHDPMCHKAMPEAVYHDGQ